MGGTARKRREALNAVAIDVFEEALHGFVRIADKLTQGITLPAGGATHAHLVAGTLDMEGGAARRARERCLGFSWAEKGHLRLLLLENTPLGAPQWGSRRAFQGRRGKP